MFNRAPTPIPGVAGTPRALLRPLIVVLALLQLAAPLTAAVTDPAPAPVSHTDHLGSPEDRGCEPFHDEAFCLSCRVLFSQPLDSRSDATPGSPLDDGVMTLRDLSGAIPSAPAPAPLRARAPPRV